MLPVACPHAAAGITRASLHIHAAATLIRGISLSGRRNEELHCAKAFHLLNGADFPKLITVSVAVNEVAIHPQLPITRSIGPRANIRIQWNKETKRRTRELGTNKAQAPRHGAL